MIGDMEAAVEELLDDVTAIKEGQDELLKEIKKNTASNLNLMEETFAALDKLTALAAYLGVEFVKNADDTYECQQKGE